MSRYALRAGGGRRPSSGLLGGSIGGGGLGSASSSVDAEVAALAALDAGLLPSSLSKEEMRRFATMGPSEYLEARSLVLSRWASDPTVELTSKACVAAAVARTAGSGSLSPEKAELIREAHRYLSLIGAINFGLIRIEEKNPPSASTPPPPPASASAAPPPSDAELLSALAAELAAADMSSTTEKALRKRLEAKFGGIDLTEKKLLLRAGVERFLAGEAVAPGGEEEDKGVKEGKEQEERARAREEERAEPPLCRPGASAVVVGAGPAGLGAALHLARCGVRVTVLEARGRAGGRASTVAARAGGAGGAGGGASGPAAAAALAAAVDLGASIVTGVAPDFLGDAALSASATAGRRSDPSALLARQLGVPLHRLGESLPLFDPASSSSPPPPPHGAGGGGGREGGGGSGGRLVPKEADERADTMRDALLDDAKDAAFHSPPPGEQPAGGAARDGSQRGRTLGEFLEASLAARLSGASASASASAARKDDEERPGGGAADAGGDEAAARERAAFAAATAIELRLLDWHWANLEYGCAAPLSRVCLSHWNQDDTFGGFGGGHAMVVGGYGALLERAAEQLSSSSPSPSSSGAGAVDLRFSTPVRGIRWGSDEGSDERRGGSSGVVVTTASGEEVEADVAIVTVPLGVLKASVGPSAAGEGKGAGEEGAREGASPPSSSRSRSPAAISFEPALPPWKADAVRALGFGKLEKVFLEFGARFWPEGLDYFGVLQPTATAAAALAVTPDGGASASPPPILLSRDPTAAELSRGTAFMFWDVGAFQSGAPPVLAALFSGAAAERFLGEGGSASAGGGGGDGDASAAAAAAAAVRAALSSLRSAFGPHSVPDPIASLTTGWGRDPFAGRGAYSFVAPGASGATYDVLARPCSRRLLFAGEHTARRHPDTVGGALLSGVREAARALGWGGVLGNAEVDGEEAMRKMRQRLKAAAIRGGGESGGERRSGSSSSSSDDESSSPSSSDEDVNDVERNERRREAAEAALARKKRKPKKTRVGQEKKTRREQPRREAAARASSPSDFGDAGAGRGPNGGYARTAEQAELDVRAAAAERADARSLWTALAAAASGADPRARAAAQALSAADAAPHRRAVALRCLTTADERSLAALAKNAGIVKTLSGWTEEAARASAGASSSFSFSATVSAAAVAADGARVLGSLPLPAAERGPSGAERAVRAVAAQCRDEGARAAAGAVLDFWFGAATASGKEQLQQQGTKAAGAGAIEAAAALEKKKHPEPTVISDDALPPELRARLLEAERAAAEAAEHAAAAERIEAQLGAARRAAAAAATTKMSLSAAAVGAAATATAAIAAPVVADIGDFDAYMAARAKEEAKRRGLKRRKDAAAAALAAAEAEEEEEEAREKKEKDVGGDDGGDEEPAAKKAASAPAPSSDGALLQEITAAVRACVSTALKRRLKQKKEKLSKEQYDGVARKAAAKIVEAEMRKRSSAEATNPASSSGCHLSDSKQEKIAKLVEGYVKAAAAGGR